MKIVIECKAPLGAAQGIKESLCMFLEQWGDARVVEIREDRAEQLRMETGGMFPEAEAMIRQIYARRGRSG